MRYPSSVGLLDVVVLAAAQGGAEALAVSASAHGAAARLWVGADRGALALQGAMQLSTAAAIAFVARGRLGPALGDGFRAVARPALLRTSPDARDAALLAVGSLMSLAVSSALRPYVEAASQAPLAVGVGLLVTAAALASTGLVPPAPDERRGGAPGSGPGSTPGWGPRPSLLGMAAAGVAHGLGGAPGGSRVGAALVLLVWLGIRPARAVELSLAITLPTLLVAGLPTVGLGAADGGLLAAGVLIAFLTAALGGAALRSLAERRRTGALALWLVPLGLAFIAYAQTLAGFA